MKLKKLAKDESGVVMVFVAVGMVIFLSFTALVVDLGVVYYDRSSVQAALDSAALAASSKLPDYDEATEVAYEYLAKNGVDSENVVIEFPSADTIRVRKVSFTDTMFGKVMAIDSIASNQLAAAQYANSSVTLDFPYLIFQGDPDAVMSLGGQFAIHGNIHTNGGVYISPGSRPSNSEDIYGDSKSYIEGYVSGSSTDNGDYYYNSDAWINGGSIGPVYYNIWSCHVGGDVLPGQPSIEMPDYDPEIMALIPTSYLEFAQNVSRWPIPSRSLNMTNYGQVAIVNSWPYLTFPCALHCTGDYNDPWLDTYIPGNLYVDGNCTLNKSAVIAGNLYVKGDLTLGGGSWMYVSGDIYCNGNIILRGNSTANPYSDESGNSVLVGGSMYCRKKMTLATGNASVVVGFKNRVYHRNNFSDYDQYYIYSGGDMSFEGGVTLTNGVIYSGGGLTTSSGKQIILRGVVIAENNISIGGVPTLVNTSLDSQGTMSMYSRNGNITFSPGANGNTVYGMVYAPHGNIRVGSGNIYFYGSMIGNTIDISSGGVTMGENNRTLPFSKSVKHAVLVE